MLLEGVIGVNVLDPILMRGPYRRVLWGLFVIGLSACAFLLHFVNFCLHGRYLALGLGQLFCSLQRILLCGQLFGEDVFLLFQGLELEAHDDKLILVGPRRSCGFECGIQWLGALRWELCGLAFLGASRIILVFLR